jgi:predicted enzyme related to lactoylglutathione lyase
MTTPIVFVDFAGPDTKALAEFYSSIFGWEVDKEGKFNVPVSPRIQGAIREDPKEKRIYLGVSDVAASLALIENAGGSVDAPRFEVPGVVVLGLFRDPAGNPMGLVEMAGESPRIP